MTLELGRKQERISGLIYAGGRGKRMGGVDKALVEIGARPMVARMSAALGNYASEIFITRQKDQADVSAYGTVLYDDAPDQGPLAGLVAGIRAALHYDYLLTVAVDADGLPGDYFTRLRAVAHPHAMAKSGTHLHPTFALIELRHTSRILTLYEQGERRLRAWVENDNCGYAIFATDGFKNINHL